MTATVETRESESVVTLTFELSVSAVRGGAVAELRGCRFELHEIVPRGNGDAAAYFDARSCDQQRIREIVAEEAIDDVYFLDGHRRNGLLEVPVTDDFPPVVLAASGAIPRRLVVERDRMILSVEVPPKGDVNAVISRFTDAYPAAEMTTRSWDPAATRPHDERDFRRALGNALTDRQREVLETAHDEGFYDWPREITGEQLSELFGISPPTLHQHLRTAERKVIRLAFDGRDPLDDS